MHKAEWSLIQSCQIKLFIMKKFTSYKAWLKKADYYVLFISLIVLANGCKKISIDKDDLRNFQQVNLVANSSTYSPVLVDPTLLNAWGLAWSPNGIAWVNSHDGHVSELYTADGAIVRPPVNIPSSTDPMGGMPTGIVFAGGAGFTLPNKQPAAFLFDGEDGVLSGWNGAAGNNAFRIGNSNSSTAHYTGLALATWNGSHLLYAANFKTGRIDVWDTTFSPVPLPFHDPFLPWGYSPFNIQSVGSWLFVMYAKVGPDGDEQPGPSLGFVDVFNPDGSFVKRFASRGPLNAPWGVTMTPANFLSDQDMSDGDGMGKKNGSNDNSSIHKENDQQPVILVGNFGDGRINVYSVQGDFLGQLHAHNNTIIIEKLWALSFAPTTATTVDPKRLYFTAGPNDEQDGLFGYLIKN
jgi:uncharacterized protein (TIGR03118 family)